MSAYLQSNDHLNVLASYCAGRGVDNGMWTELDGEYQYITPETAEKVFDKLLAENVRSLQARYPQYPEMWERAKEYTFEYIEGVKRLYSVGEVAFAVDGYEYQACEAYNHEDSEAYKLTQDMRKYLLKQLEDYEVSNTWSIDQARKSEYKYI